MITFFLAIIALALLPVAAVVVGQIFKAVIVFRETILALIALFSIVFIIVVTSMYIYFS